MNFDRITSESHYGIGYNRQKIFYFEHFVSFHKKLHGKTRLELV